MEERNFKPYVSSEQNVAEFTVKSVLVGSLFGILFGCSTVYLALKAGLTVTASIPIAVIAITLGRKFLKTTILENNIIQTTGSAGESIAAGVVFTLPGFLFLSPGENGVSVGEAYFDYLTILILAAFGGMLGTLMMIPLRRSLIVKEHGTLPYPGEPLAHRYCKREKKVVFLRVRPLSGWALPSPMQCCKKYFTSLPKYPHSSLARPISIGHLLPHEEK